MDRDMLLEYWVDRFLDYLRVERNASAYTTKSYAEDLQVACSFWAKELTIATQDLPVTALSTRMVRAFIAFLGSRNYAASSVRRRLSAIRSFVRYLCREGVLDRDPTKGLRGPKIGRPLPEFMPENQIEKLLEAPDNHTTAGLRDRALLETCYAGGLRVGELVAINVADLDLDTGMVHVRGKGKRERLTPIGKFAVVALYRYLAVRVPKRPDEPALFLNKFGTRLTVRSVGRMLEKYLAFAGLDPTIHPHTLRHTFATHLLNRGADIRSVQELLGHARVTTTQIYTHLTADRLRSDYDQYHPHDSAEKAS